MCQILEELQVSADHHRQVTHGVLKAGLTRRDFVRADRKVGDPKASDANTPDDDHDHRSRGTLYQLQFKDEERAGEQLGARRLGLSGLLFGVFGPGRPFGRRRQDGLALPEQPVHQAGTAVPGIPSMRSTLISMSRRPSSRASSQFQI